jgi:small-conductance mechanosensitive channel
MPRGGARPNSEPKKGSKQRQLKSLAERAEQIHAAAEAAAKLLLAGELTPLELLLCVMRDKHEDMRLRLKAGTAAAPYVHKRRPQAVDVTGSSESMTAEQIEYRRRLLLDEIRSRLAH